MSNRHISLGLAATLTVTLTACSSNTSVPSIVDASFNPGATAQNGLYTVKRGDTIYSIAWQQNTDFHRLAELNNIAPPYAIQPGQTLRLNANAGAPANTAVTSTAAGVQTIPLGGGAQPAGASSDDDSWLVADTTTAAQSQTGSVSPSLSGTATQSAVTVGGAVQTGTGASAAGQARTPSPAAPSSTTPSSSQADNVSVAGQSASQTPASAAKKTYTPAQNIQWQWPVNGEVIGTFADKTNLTAGIDIAGQKGQSVKAAGPGIVVYAGSGVRGYGNLIILKHNDHFLSAYAHNDTLKVKENDVVDAGQTIATMGDSEANRVELHFEIRQDGQPKDPLKYLPDR